MDQSTDELRQVAECLENYLVKNPDKSRLWLDIAYIRFRLFAVESCLKVLEQLEQNAPDYKRTEQFLLRARCLLELGDTLGFEQNYKSALDSAEKEGDFTRLIFDSEPIFRPEETKKAARLKTPAEFADFFRTFWKRRDPDPISLRNERLVEHYVRLREAEKIYHMKNPHSFFQTSHNYFRLLSPFSAGLKYDPDIFWNRSRSLALDQRGLLFVRHGPPDRILLSEPPPNGPPPSIEVWRYGSVFFPFEYVFGAGDYLFVPAYVRGIGNIKKAMDTDFYKDPLPQFKQDFYGADFMAQNGKIEMEFYQSAPVSKASLTETPEVSLAVFDLSWKEIARDSSRTLKIFTGRDSLWIGVNSVQLEPGNCLYAVRMDIPGRRAVNGILRISIHTMVQDWS